MRPYIVYNDVVYRKSPIGRFYLSSHNKRLHCEVYKSKYPMCKGDKVLAINGDYTDLNPDNYYVVKSLNNLKYATSTRYP